jgi:hypothetical protein
VELEERVIERINQKILDDVDFVSTFPKNRPTSIAWLDDNGYSQVLEAAQKVARLPQARSVVGSIQVCSAKLEDLVEREQTVAVEEERSKLQLDLDRLQRVRQQVQEANRNLLLAWYGDLIRGESTVFAYVVLGNDQFNRFVVAMIALVVFVVLGGLVNVNVTSAHSYYRSRLAEMWVYRQTRTGTDIRIGQLKNTARGGPYHLINSCVHLLGPNRELGREPTECFLFSQQYCGSDRVDYEKTETYDVHGITLADAMAISGAAISPLAVSSNPLLFYVMLLTNARLGQWVPNPGNVRWPNYPTFVSALLGYFTGTPEKSAFLYVTDGGHHDNTGIEPLLRRRCKIIVACDASWDPQSHFLDLLRLFRRMTESEGIQFLAPEGTPLQEHDEIPVQLHSLVADERTGLSLARCVVIKVVYPTTPQDELKPDHERQPNGRGKSVGWLIYLKSTLTKSDPPTLLKYREDNKAFPHDPTLDQFYDQRRFHCYRQLGFQLGSDLSTRLPIESTARKGAWLSRVDFSAGPNVVDAAGAPAEPGPEPAPVVEPAVSATSERGAAAPIRGKKRAFNERNFEKASTKPGVFALYQGQRLVLFGRGAKKGGIRRSLREFRKYYPSARITSFNEEVTRSYLRREEELRRDYVSRYGELPLYNRSSR